MCADIGVTIGGPFLDSQHNYCMCYFPRGIAGGWYEALHPYLLFSSKPWSRNGLLRLFSYITEKDSLNMYLLESPSTEVVHHIVGLVHALCWCCATSHILLNKVTHWCTLDVIVPYFQIHNVFTKLKTLFSYPMNKGPFLLRWRWPLMLAGVSV